MVYYKQLKPAVTRFRCDVPGLDTEKVYVVNGKRVHPHVGQQGFQIRVEAARLPTKPLQVINVREGNGLAEIYCENRLTIAAGASASLIVCDHTASERRFVTETLNTITLEEGARLDLLLMQNEHNSAVHTTKVNVQQAPRSSFSCTVVTLHGGIIENQIHVELQGKEAACTLNGLFLCDGDQRVTNTVQVRHAVPLCRSKQLFKGLLNDHSTGHFNGHIIVDKNAQQTEALQENHNILLTHSAKMYIQPHLEIYADDVKCTHGATIGRIDENALFYLRSRGISLTEARLLQQFAFAHNVIERIALQPLQERIAALVNKRLHGELYPCTC